jgi:hypothetical protein
MRRHFYHALREVTVATAIPLLLFSLSQGRYGNTVAIAITALWTLGVTITEAVRRRRVSGLIILTLTMLAIKAASGLATGSSFVFFAVPCAGTAATGAMFAWSGNWANPLLVRLAGDVVPFLSGHLEASLSRPFVLRLSWTWGIAYLANAAGSFLLLVFTPLHAFMVLHVVASWFCTSLACAVTVLLARRHGPHILAALKSGKPAEVVPLGGSTEDQSPPLAA